jgi:hypothetical protein
VIRRHLRRVAIKQSHLENEEQYGHPQMLFAHAPITGPFHAIHVSANAPTHDVALRRVGYFEYGCIADGFVDSVASNCA